MGKWILRIIIKPFAEFSGYLVALAILAATLKSPWFKGVMGEFAVNLAARLFLDKAIYHLVKNVTLPTEDGSTQIDHIIVSKFGVFVVETKNMKGWIFGGAHQKLWTQKIYRHSNKFQNPLHQNHKHVLALVSLLGLGLHQIFSVVVFVGDSTFKTDMPENVTHSRGYIRFIRSKRQVVLTDKDISGILDKIQSGRLPPSFKTNRAHVRHVKAVVASKDNVRLCPKCGGKLVLRVAKRAGNQFLGCENYPKCKTALGLD